MTRLVNDTVLEQDSLALSEKKVFGVIAINELEDLSFGKVSEPVSVQYSLYGDTSCPVVVVLGGITANRYVADSFERSDASNNIEHGGWWGELVGTGKAIDTDKYCVVSFNYISSVRVETESRQSVTHSLTPADQAKVLKSLLIHLNITKSITIVGSSYGGMVGLSFAELYPADISHLLCISASDRSTHTARAIRSIQKGIFALAEGPEQDKKALALARQLSIIFYRTDDIFDVQFAIPELLQPLDESTEYDNTIYSYLNHQGQKFANKTEVSNYVALLDSIDTHVISPEKIKCQCSFVAVPNDRLVSYESMRRLAHKVGEKAQFYRLESIYGHDAFLKEFQYLTNLLSKVLGESDEPSSSYASC